MLPFLRNLYSSTSINHETFNFGTKLKTILPSTELRSLLLNRLKITPGTVAKLVKRYQVKIFNSNNVRLHPTLLLKLPINSTVQLQGFRLEERKIPLSPNNDNERYDLLKKKAFNTILREALEGSAGNVRVLFEDDQILVVNKPYNTKATELFGSNLFLVNELMSNETGILIFAKNEKILNDLKSKLDSNRISPTIKPVYWAMTLRIYKETPFGEVFSLQYRGRNDHRPRFLNEERWTTHQHLRANIMDEGISAITQWRHISTHIAKLPNRRVKMGLYELAPITMRPGQLRIQLAEQLRCPIVGDWLYSPSEQIKLKIHPNYPLHLHLYQITLKGYLKGENDKVSDLVIKAPIPAHFIMTMNKHKMFLPTKPKLKKPRHRSNVKRLVDRFYPGQKK